MEMLKTNFISGGVAFAPNFRLLHNALYSVPSGITTVVHDNRTVAIQKTQWLSVLVMVCRARLLSLAPGKTSKHYRAQ